MKKLILAALGTTLTLSPLAATAAEAQVHRTVITERGPRGHVVERTVVTRGHRAGWHRWQRAHRPYRHHYVVRSVTTRYR